MTATMIEQETGTYVRTDLHPHNGYYAGDFSSRGAQLDGFERAHRASAGSPVTR